MEWTVGDSYRLSGSGWAFEGYGSCCVSSFFTLLSCGFSYFIIIQYHILQLTSGTSPVRKTSKCLSVILERMEMGEECLRERDTVDGTLHMQERKGNGVMGTDTRNFYIREDM